MIVHYAQGGLGNQFFNYAATRSLADHLGTELLIDVENYRDQWDSNASRPFLLTHFPVRAKYRNLGRDGVSQPLFARIARRLREEVISKQLERPLYEIAYFDEFLRLGRNTVLKGHFVDYRFFSWNSHRISEDLRLTESVLGGDSRGEKLFAEIKRAECSVAVHVRRGDLLEEKYRWLLLDGVENYYRKAMEIIQSRYPAAVFYIFSDDPAWCTTCFANFDCTTKIVTEGNCSARDTLIDFFLMTNCKHQVIANSAFSWWAAWLNPNLEKTILAPYIYDNNKSIPIDQLIPSEWQKVDW
ncbi:MAG: alpha-1,2-fucosyltransferase [Gammaproteobacteria bacterium]|nr:alpha-1,2-fucosyltransferase [Gammaproteobacteria bacterium]MDH5694878.1 alpha-1,2-fucosyltransferase [Gammaproteobacteria bacterium]